MRKTMQNLGNIYHCNRNIHYIFISKRTETDLSRSLYPSSIHIFLVFIGRAQIKWWQAFGKIVNVQTLCFMVGVWCNGSWTRTLWCSVTVKPPTQHRHKHMKHIIGSINHPLSVALVVYADVRGSHKLPGSQAAWRAERTYF